MTGHNEDSRLIVLGAVPGTRSFGLAVSLAALYGLLAGQRTLLADLNWESGEASRHPGLLATDGLLSLVDQFLATQHLEANSVRAQITPVAMPVEHPLAGRSFDRLAGLAGAAPEHTDSLSVQRGEAFVRALHEQIALLHYDMVIVDFGPGLDTLRGAALANVADLVVIVGRRADPAARAFIQERLQPPHFKPPPERLLLVEPGEYAFPHPEFLDSLTVREKRFENATVRTALGLAERLHPGLSKKLTDAAGRPIRPVRPGLLRRLLG